MLEKLVTLRLCRVLVGKSGSSCQKYLELYIVTTRGKTLRGTVPGAGLLTGTEIDPESSADADSESATQTADSETGPRLPVLASLKDEGSRDHRPIDQRRPTSPLKE